MTTSSFAYLENLEALIGEIPPDSILSRTFYQDEKIKAILFGFDKGQELSEHTASTSAILYFLRGEAALTLGGEAKQAKAGTWVYMPPHLPHSVVAKTPLVMLLIMFAS